MEREPEGAREGPVWAFDPEPPEQPGRPNVHGDELDRAVGVHEAQVVDAHDFAAVNVDDLLVHQVLAEPDLVRALLEAADIDRSGAQTDARLGERGDGGPREKYLAAVGCDDDAGDGRILPAHGDDQVGNLAHRLAVLVEHGPADDLAEIEHVFTSGGLPPSVARMLDARNRSDGGKDRDGDPGLGAGTTRSGLH